jgi:hypothetical protein
VKLRLALVLNVMRNDYPLLRPELGSMMLALEKNLIARRLEIAFLANPIRHLCLQLQPLGAQCIVWAPTSVWELPTRVRPIGLKSIPIITNPPPSTMYRQSMIGSRRLV